MVKRTFWGWGASGLVALGSLPLPAQALPAGGSVVAGEAAITPISDSYLEINQSSDRAVLHWDSFNLSDGHRVHFNQPSVDAATLNRVTGSTPSSIAGQVTAVGNVMLINPNGILFTETAQIDVGGLLGTTLAVDEVGFMAGQPLSLSAGQGAPGSVVNRGQITVRDAGYAALVAPHVVNQGVIRARLGRVDLASGTQATVDFYGDGLLRLAVDPALAYDPEIATLIEHSGTISADGGQVWLSAEAGTAILDYVINTSGVILAQHVENQDGRIVLSGGNQGTVAVSGRLDTGRSEVGAGEIAITGNQLLIDGPRLYGDTTLSATERITLQGDVVVDRRNQLDFSAPRLVLAGSITNDGSTLAPGTATGTVGTTVVFGPGPGTLQNAVDATDDGGVVLLAVGEFRNGSTVVLNNRALTIQGQGAGADPSNNTIVSGEGQYRVFSVTNGATVTFDQLRIQDGVTPTDGGWPNRSGGGVQILGRNSTVTIQDSALVNNRARYGGGAIGNSDGTVTILRSTLSGNSVLVDDGRGSGGGAVFSNIADNSDVNRNNNDFNRLTISNSTISGNTAATVGGGVYVRRGQALIEDSTITNNIAVQGSGVAARGFVGENESNTVAAIGNSIVSGNSGNNDVDLIVDVVGEGINTFESRGFNLIGGGGSAGAFNNNDILSTQPGLGPLADNGGPTQTHALLPNSPALNAGRTEAATDQRGELRDDTPDIGAFELQAEAPPKEPPSEEPSPEEPSPEEPPAEESSTETSVPQEDDDFANETGQVQRLEVEESSLPQCQAAEALPELPEGQIDGTDLPAGCALDGRSTGRPGSLPALLLTP